MNDLNWYLMNKDHDFITNPTGMSGVGPIVSSKANSGTHLIGMNPPPGGATSNEEKLNKFAKIKPSMSRERVGQHPHLINLHNYNFKPTSLMMNAVVGAPQSVVHHQHKLSDLN